MPASQPKHPSSPDSPWTCLIRNSPILRMAAHPSRLQQQDDSDSDVEAELQRELDAINLIPEHGVGAGRTPHDKDGQGLEVEEEVFEEQGLASFECLVNRWHLREQKLQTFNESLDEIGVWMNLRHVEKEGGGPVPASASALACPKPLEHLESQDAETADNPSHAWQEHVCNKASVKCSSNPSDLNQDGNVLMENYETSTGTDSLVGLQRQRAQVLQQYRAVAVEKSRAREIKRFNESEDTCKELAVVAKKEQALQHEQAKRLADLENERALAARVFAEEQKKEQDMLEAQKHEIERRCRAIQDTLVDIKLREDEVVKHRVEYQAAQDLKFFIEARRRFAAKKISKALRERRSLLEKCCRVIQAMFRQYLYGKRQRELRHQKLQALEDGQVVLQEDVVQPPLASTAENTCVRSDANSAASKCESHVNLAVATATGKFQSKMQRLRQLFKKASKMCVKTGMPNQSRETRAPEKGEEFVMKLAEGDGCDELADGIDFTLHCPKVGLTSWLTQFIEGWEVGRCEAQKKIEEAGRLGLHSVATHAESVIVDREKRILANLGRCVEGGSLRAVQHWIFKARRFGFDEMLVKCLKDFEERIERTKENLTSVALNGSREDYMAAFKKAHSLGLQFEVEQAANIVRQRAVFVVKTAKTMASALRTGSKKWLRKWDTLEEMASRLGMSIQVLDFFKRFASETTLSNLARVFVTVRTDDRGTILKVVEKLQHGPPQKFPGNGDGHMTFLSLEQCLADSNVHRMGDGENDAESRLLHHQRQRFAIWSFEENWHEINKLRGRWQEQMIASRVFQPSELHATATKQPPWSDRIVSSSIPICEDDNVVPAEVCCRLSCEHQQHHSDCKSRGKGDDSCEAAWVVHGYPKGEEGAEDMLNDLDEENEGDERRDQESSSQMHQAFLVRSDDSFEWERTLCMPLVLTRPMLEQKANLRSDLSRLTKLDVTYDGLSSLGEGNLGQWCPALRFLVLDRNKLTSLKGALKGCERFLEHISAKDNFISSLAGLENLQALTILHLEGNSLRHVAAASPHKAVFETVCNQGGFKEFAVDIDTSLVEDGQFLISRGPYGTSAGSKVAEANRKPVSGKQDRVQDDAGFLPQNCWPRLKELGLSCNKLAKVVCLGSICPQLEVLDLSSNQLVTLGGVQGHALTGLKCLRVLDVGQNNLKGRSLWEALKNCPLLLSLVASRNRLSELPTHPGSVFLRELWLNGNAIRRLACNAWLPNLQRLYLQDNSIDTLEPLCGCPALEVLDLSFNNISELCQLQQLGCFPSLRSLQLNDNPVSEQANYVEKVLEAVPWLMELDNEAVSETSKNKAVMTIFLSVIDAVGPRYIQDNIEKLRLWLPRCTAAAEFQKRVGADGDNAHRCPPVDDASFDQFLQRATENVGDSTPRQTPWSLNALLSGFANRETLWTILSGIVQSMRTNHSLRLQLGMDGDMLERNVQGHLRSNNMEARWNGLAFQQMGYVHRQRLQGGFCERNSCEMKEWEQYGHDNTSSSMEGHDLFPLHPESEIELSRQGRGKFDSEQYLSDHTNFCHVDYKEMFEVNSAYGGEMDVYKHKIVKLQALARRLIAKLVFKKLCVEREEEKLRELARLQEEAMIQENAVCALQAFWKGLKVRRLGLLDSLRAEALERLNKRNAATKLQAAWRGCSIRVKLKQALARCRYVDDDEYDYITIDENEFAMDDDSFLEEMLPSGVDDVTYSGVEFILGKKVSNGAQRDSRLSAVSPSTRTEKTGGSSPTIPGGKKWTISALPSSASPPSGLGTGRTPKCNSRVATTTLRSSAPMNAQKPGHDVHGKKNVTTGEGNKQLRPNVWKDSPRKGLKQNVFPPHSKIEKSKLGHDKTVSVWVPNHPYLRQASEKKKETLAVIVKDWGFKDEKTAESFMKAREKVKGHARAKGEAYKALLQDPQRRLKIFRARTKMQTSQVEAAPLGTGKFLPLGSGDVSRAKTCSNSEPQQGNGTSRRENIQDGSDGKIHRSPPIH